VAAENFAANPSGASGCTVVWIRLPGQELSRAHLFHKPTMQPRFREPWRNSVTAVAAPNSPAGRKSAAVKPDIRGLVAQRSKTAVFELAMYRRFMPRKSPPWKGGLKLGITPFEENEQRMLQ
jgi:hypothetical protein